MSSPGIILTSKFSLPNSNDFTKFVSYLTREQALLKEEKLTKSETKELKLIQKNKQELFQQPGRSSKSYAAKNSKKKLQEEANHLVNDDFDFNNLDKMDFTKMVTYMSRSYALRQKPNPTSSEQFEIKRIDQAMDKIIDRQAEAQDNLDKANILNDVFDQDRDFISVNDLSDVKDKFLTAQKNGSVMYQDVVSFDNNFLKQIGLLDDHNNLNESRLKVAANSMMDRMFKLEKLQDTGYWFASIHRNTDNVHIHFATVESTNTRKIVQRGKYLEPKGKRRQKTIDAMKTTFTHNLLDRSTELTRISELRNDLVKGIKTELQNNHSRKINHLVRELYRFLPEDHSYWNYGAAGPNQPPIKKAINKEAKEILDQITTEIVQDNPDFKEYQGLIKQESGLDQALYGKSKRSTKDYEQNKTLDLKKRLGNSVLKELKQRQLIQTKKVNALNKMNSQYAKRRYVLQKRRHYKAVVPKFVPYFNRKLDRILSNDVKQQRNQYFYQQMQRAAERGQSY